MIKKPQVPSDNLVLITGAARSGKSELAESLAGLSKRKVYFVATMVPINSDNEINSRLFRHRERRPSSWITFESPVDISSTIEEIPDGPGLVLIDCLSVFVSNVLLKEYKENEDPYDLERDVLIKASEVLIAIERRPDLEFIIVTNEVGWSVVPDNALARAYRDFLGIVNQMFAEAAHTVWLVCVGQHIKIKPMFVN